MSISTALKSILKTVPPIKALISERDALRLKVALLEKASPRNMGNPSLINEKLEVLDLAFSLQKVNSFADLGAIGLVDGGYTFYALDRYGPGSAVLVDSRPSNNMVERGKKYPQLRIIRGNFGDKRIVQEVGQTDMIFLLDILLHQATPHWDEILEMYGRQTRCLVIFNPQWIKTELTTRLLDLGENEYFKNIPHDKNSGAYDNLFQKLDQKAPGYDKTWRDIHHIWQWGITDNDLIEKVRGLGFRMQYFRNFGQFENLINFENHAFIFSK